VAVLFPLAIPSTVLEELMSMLQPSSVAVFSSVSKSCREIGKRAEYWIFAGISFIQGKCDAGTKFHKVMTSFVGRGYSHPAYRAYCWFRETAYNRVDSSNLLSMRLESNESVDKVSCVWRNWVFDPLRANKWTTERRVQVWMAYLDHNCKIWFPLPKNYTLGFYDRFPTDPFLLQRPPHEEQLLLSSPKMVRVLREESSSDLDERLRQLKRTETEMREKLEENSLEVQIIEAVRRAQSIPSLNRFIENLL
jgi:hypothetical protein